MEYEALDAQTLARAKALLLDHLGCLLLGSTLSWTKTIYRYVSGYGGNRQARIANYGDCVPVHDAALVNAVFAQGFEWDDFATRGMGAGHPGAGTWPVGLAVGELIHSSGKDLLAACVAGYECMSRVGKALGSSSDGRGHHRQGLLAPLGAAAVAGRLLQLSEHQLIMALGIAASHSAGLNEFARTGGEVKRLHAGIGVRSGVQSAFLGQMGFTGPPNILEGDQGFCHAFSDEVRIEEITKPADQYEIMESGIKLYPTVATALTSIEAIAELMARKGFSWEQIEEIDAQVAGRAIRHGGLILEPHDVAGAQFSIPFSIALQAVTGSNDLANYMNPELWRDPRILDIANRVRLTADPAAIGDKRHSCQMTVVLRDGSVHTASKPFPRGSFLNPVSLDETKEKFAALASRVVRESRVLEVIEAVESIERMNDVSELVDLLCLRPRH